MAIDNNVITLADYAKQSNAPIVAKIADGLYRFGSVMSDWPLQTYKSLNIRGVRLRNTGLAAPSWRKLNQSTTVTKSVFDPFSEQAYILSNAIDIDTKLIEDVNQIGGPGQIVGQQMQSYIQAVTYDLNDKFINNDHVTGNADAPVGIRYRLDNPLVMGANASNRIDCGGVDMSTALTPASANTFIELVTQALQEIGSFDGQNCVIYMNRTLVRRFERAIRVLGAGGGFDMTQDAFSRMVPTFRNAPIRTIGVKADGVTEIITNTETSAGVNGASTFSSFYVVRYGEDGVQPWQMDEMYFKIIGARSDEPNMYRLFLDWAVGYIQYHPRAIARGFNIKVS